MDMDMGGYTKVAKAAALLSLLVHHSAGSSSSFVNTNTSKFLEPIVQRHIGVLPESVCKELIDLGDKAGFLVQEESIDKKEQNDPNEKFIPSQTIDVYTKSLGYPYPYPDNARIENREIWTVLEPHMHMLTKIVKDNRDKEAFAKFHPNDPDSDDREPELNWVFLRKYSPNDERNSLKPHQDTNMYTLNIELNDDYVGGGWLYVKPPTNDNGDDVHVQGHYKTISEDGVHHIPEDYMSYDWTNGLRRENSSEVVFPTLLAGDALLYNFTVYHAVAPISSGTRYSMSLFYDFINPAGLLPNNNNNNKERKSETAKSEIAEAHYITEFKVQFHNTIPDVEVDIILVYDAATQRETWEEIFRMVVPHEVTKYLAIEGDVLVALVAGRDEVVFGIKIRRDRTLYVIEDERGRMMNDEDEL